MSDTILIVDDSLTVRMDLADAFRAAGFRPIPCCSAAEARAALEHGPVDVMVLDVLLPDIDGVEFLKELRAREALSTTPVLMLSTEAEIKDRIRGLKTGADEYVGKPYETRYLIAKARELLRKRAPTPDRTTSILIIDDSPTFREELRSVLEREGYATITAASGEEGLAVAADHRPGAIIVDGVLPGIDGATVIRHIRLDVALRGVPCILLTGSESRGAELRALDAGADDFVLKDQDPGVILAKLAAVLRRATAVGSAPVSSVLSPKKILAVDDSVTYLEELAGALHGEGYEVVCARSGEEALELLAVQSVDCILLDLLMPGLGGQETCRRIKAAPVLRDTPLVMLTALEERDAMIEGLSSGADDYIAKSSEFAVVKARVRAQIRRKHFEDENRRIRDELLSKELEASEARAARELAATRATLVEELERKNKELEAFSYSVSHDLRAPLRSIDGFSQALLEDCASCLDESRRSHLRRVRAAAQRMGQLIDDLLQLSRVGRAPLNRVRVDVSALGRAICEELQRKDPERKVIFAITDGLTAQADSGLLRILLENLLGNAWKFTSKVPEARVELCGREREGWFECSISDNGAGFNMEYVDKLFGPFQRLHSEAEFPGTGIGLATVYRIVDRHGGRISAQGALKKGATFSFALPAFGTGASA